MAFLSPPSALRRVGRFLLQVVAIGFALALLLSLTFGEWAHLGLYTGICVFFTALMGGGFQFVPRRWLDPDLRDRPGRAALRMQATWLGLSLLMLGLGFGILRLWAGPKAFGGFGIVVTYLVSLLMTSLAVGRHTAVTLVARTQELERARARAGYLALQAQLQPHTFFNGLNAILARVRPDPEGAEAAIRSLARLLRHTMVALERESWTLQEECDVLQSLLELERSRFGDRLAFEVHLVPEAETVLIPPLLLLPLVENSLKHGFRSKVGPCRLEVWAEPRCIRVIDDGVGRLDASPEGVGLKTVRQRLEALGGRLWWPPMTRGCEARVELP